MVPEKFAGLKAPEQAGAPLKDEVAVSWNHQKGTQTLRIECVCTIV